MVMGIPGLPSVPSLPSFELVDDSEDWKNCTFKNNLKVLLVDDGETEKAIWKMVLDYFAVESCTADNGREAINRILAGENFDLILVDKYMPIMNGVEAIRMLRSMGVVTKIVGVGLRSTIEERLDLLNAGSDDYVSKPIHPARFVAWLKEIDEAK